MSDECSASSDHSDEEEECIPNKTRSKGVQKSAMPTKKRSKTAKASKDPKNEADKPPKKASKIKSKPAARSKKIIVSSLEEVTKSSEDEESSEENKPLRKASKIKSKPAARSKKDIVSSLDEDTESSEDEDLSEDSKPLRKASKIKSKPATRSKKIIVPSSNEDTKSSEDDEVSEDSKPLKNKKLKLVPRIIIKPVSSTYGKDGIEISDDSDQSDKYRKKGKKFSKSSKNGKKTSHDSSDKSSGDEDSSDGSSTDDSDFSGNDSQSSEINEWEPNSKASLAAKKIVSNKKIQQQDSKDVLARFDILLEQTEELSQFIRSASNKSRGRPKSKNKVKGNKAFQFESSPDYINGEMRDYQVRGLNWMINLYENGLNGILADEMGLGKTLQTISLLGFLRHHKKISGKHLIFAPKSTLENWVNEFKRWCPEIKVCGFYGDQEQRAKIITKQINPGKFDVMVSNYEMCLNESDVFKNQSWKFIIVDEGHRMKNEKNLFSTQIRTLDSTNRLLLTGTPLQNNLHELWALLNFLLPDIFKSADDFDSWFDTDKCLTDKSLVKRLHKILAPFLLRRLKYEVEFSLKPKVEFKLYCGITKMQRENYIKVLKKELLFLVNGQQTVRKSSVMMQLRQLVNHPYLIPGLEPEPHVTDENLVNCCGKLQMLDKLLVMLENEGSRVLIFTQFVSMLDILEDFLMLRNYKYSRLDGSSTYEDRKENIEEFNTSQSETFVFIISTRAGGLGINLQTADTVIVYDSDWNPQSDIQAIDRAHRIGQKKQVRVFRLIAEKTIDERIVERAEIKLCLDKKIIQEGRLLTKHSLKKNEALNMIQQDADDMLKSTESTVTDEDINAIIKRSMIKSEELKQKVEANEVNFDTIFKFDGELYKNVEVQKEETIEPTKRSLKTKKPYRMSFNKSDMESNSANEGSDFDELDESDGSSTDDEEEGEAEDGDDPATLERKKNKKSEDKALKAAVRRLARKKLLDKKFNWTKEQRYAYFEQMELLGRARSKLITMLKHIHGKAYAQLREFHAHFWRYNLIEDEKRAKEAIRNVITAEHTKSLNYIMSQDEIIINQPEFSKEADLFLLRRVHELYQEPVPKTNKRWWIFMKVLDEMKIHENFSQFVEGADHIKLCKHFETLKNVVERTLRILEAREPKAALKTNSQLQSVSAYRKKYVKPILHDFQFYPPALHELVKKEYEWSLTIIDQKTLTLPITDLERDEMEWMRQQGFCDWSKTDFKQFLQGLEASGAADIKKLQTFIPSKTEADVKKYSDVFWTRYHELDDESVRNSVAQMAPKLNGFRTEAPAKDYVLDCLDSRLMYQFAIRQALIDLKGMSSITIPYCDALPADGFNEAVDKFILWKITELFCSDEDFYEIIQKQAANLMKSEMTLQEIRARCKQLFAVYSLKQKESSDELESLDYFFQPDLEKLDELKLKRKTLMDSETLVNSSNERNKLKRATQNARRQFRLGQHLWSRKDLLRFFEAFQKFGRTDIEEITKFIDTKTSLEVRNYSSVFWRRFKELEDVSLKKIAEETLDLDMVKKLQRFLLDKGSEAIPEHNKENDDDCRLIAVLKEFDLEDVKDVMSDILDKLKSFNTGKSAEDVRSKCQQLMKTHELLLEFTNLGLPEITFVKVEPLKQSAEELEKRAELLKIKRAKKAEKDANSPRKIARAAEKVEKAKLALGAKLSKENASKSPKKLAKEKASKSPKKLAKEKASKAAAKSKSPKKPAKTLKNAKSPKKDVKTKKRQDVETSRSSKKRKQEFWDADAAEPKKCRIEVKRLSNELLKEVDLTEVAPENVKWPKTRKTKKEK